MMPINIGIPGIKPGFSNIVVIFSLYVYSPLTAFGIAIVRIILVGLTFGNFASLMYSFAGGMLSFVIMGECCRRSKPQHRSDNSGNACSQNKTAYILSSGSYNIGYDSRNSSRHSRRTAYKKNWKIHE